MKSSGKVQTPTSLKPGDKVAIVSPARSITFEEVYPSIRLFQKWGLEVVLGTHMFNKSGQFAGPDDQRRMDLQQMLDDPSIRAVFCSRGGYGTVRIIDGIDFTEFCRAPKWVIGYSDVTVLHSHIHRHCRVETLHAVMPVNIGPAGHEDSLETLRSVLFGSKVAYTFNATPGSRPGEAAAPLVGGNLSILYSLMGSSSEIDTEGKILLLEDVDEYLYHIDRMMMNLKRAGKLDRLKGMIVGGMDRMNDNTVPYGKTANEIIASAVEEYAYPVCFDFPAGHGDKNLALILGRTTRLKVGNKVEIFS